MSRMFFVACAMGLGLSSAAAQELELKPPQLTARRCTAHQRDVCEGVEDRALEHDLACGACDRAPMPADFAPPSRSQPPIECAMNLMPLGPPAPGCTSPPVDSVPRP